MFKQGKQKTGGRKPGVKNKKTVLFEGKIEECGAEALTVMVQLLTDKNKHYRFLASKELLKYIYPTKKQSDVELKTAYNKEEAIKELKELFGYGG